MSYLGLQPDTPLLNTSTETFSGNSVATQFTLARSVASASDLDVMIGSTLQRPFTDYIAGNISLQFITPPGTGANNITVTYRGGALNSLDLTASVFNAGTVANPSVVSLAANNTGIYWANASSMSVTVSGTNRATFMANATSISTDTGALIVDGGLGVDANVNIGGRVAVFDSTESTSVSTGSFKTSGGAGIVGNLNVGGDITCVGDFTVNGTFTTTGTDSLAVTDPFIFLAENNPGDTYDSGVVTQFYDGANTRYSGYFRDITDAKYKLFTNLLVQPTTTVDTTDPSFEYTDLILANLSATGNVSATYFVGNGAALTGIQTTTSNIFNANTSVAIAAVNANVNMVVNSVQIANVWSGGISVVGAVAASTTVSATGNVTGGNVNTAGLVTATGNITSAANVTGGNILTGGIVSSSGNVTGGNVLTGGVASATGNVIGGNVITGGLIVATGNITGGNITTAGKISAASIVATGNIDGGNLILTGEISAAGNIFGPYILGNGSQLVGISVNSIQNGTSNVNIQNTNGNVTIGVGGTSNVVVLSALGAEITGFITATGDLAADGNVAFVATTQHIDIGTLQTTGELTFGGSTQTGAILIGQSTYPQTVAIANGVTGTGNTKTVSIGESGAAGSTTLIKFGPVSATTAAGTATFNTATIVAIANTSGTALSVAGNITGANIRTGGSVSATGNVTTGNVNTGGLINATGNITGGNIVTAAAVSAASISASSTVAAAGNITGGNILSGGLFSVTGNVTGGNINTVGLVTATGNITSTANVAGGNIITANLVQGSIVSATSNVIATANVSGAYFLGTGISLSGNVIGDIATTANITGSNIIATAAMSAVSVSASGNITGGNVLGGANVNATLFTGTTISVSGNITGGNVSGGSNVNATTHTGTTVSVSANVTGGNILTGGQLISTQTGNSDTGAGQLFLNGSGNNRIDFNINGTGAPAFTTRSAGAKVVLYPNLGASAADYALGIDAGVLWSGVPDSSGQFKWYAGTTQVGSLSGAGAFSAVGSITGAAITGTSLNISTGTANVGSITNANANGVGNIGNSTVYFNTVFAKATSAQYADLAEWYEADADYEPGTVLVFGGDKEVTVAIGINDVRVAGVVSTNPAHIMNSGLKAEYTAALALTGRVPTMVVGAVKKGDMMVTAGGGRAQACAEPRMGSVIGKALQDHPGGQGIIEIVVGKL